MKQLWDMGYAASDIMGTLIATAKRIDMDEALRLELVKVSNGAIVAGAFSLFFLLEGISLSCFFCASVVVGIAGRCWRHAQEIGITHGRVVRGLGTLLQLDGLLARMCRVSRAACSRPPQ